MPNGIPDDQTEFPQPSQSVINHMDSSSGGTVSSSATGNTSAAVAAHGTSSSEKQGSRLLHFYCT